MPTSRSLSGQSTNERLPFEDVLPDDCIDPVGRIECDLRQIKRLFRFYDRLVDLQTQPEVGPRRIVRLQYVGNDGICAADRRYTACWRFAMPCCVAKTMPMR